MKLTAVASVLFFTSYALADFNIEMQTCLYGFGGDGGVSSTLNQVRATHDQQYKHGCDFGRNPCNCQQAWDMRKGRDRNTYEVWEGNRNIGYCKPEGGSDYTCHGALYVCYSSKSHICYTANCGPHRRSLTGRQTQLEKENWTPTDFKDAGKIVTKEEFAVEQKALFAEWAAAAQANDTLAIDGKA